MTATKKVKVIVYSCRNLRSRKGNGDPLAWVVFGFGKDKKTTKQKRDRCPSWNEESEFTVTDTRIPFKLTVKEKDGILGQLILPLSELPSEEHCVKWVELGPHRKNPSPVGEVCLDCWIDEGFELEDEMPKKLTQNLNIRHVLGRLSQSTMLRRSTEDLAAKKSRFSKVKSGKSLKGSMSMEFLSMSKENKFRKKMPLTKNSPEVSPKLRKVAINSSPETTLPYLTSSSPLLGRSLKYIPSVTESADPPEVTIVSPNHGPLTGGTLIQISGHNLGKNAGDIITLSIGNFSCLNTLEYYSPEKLMCTTGKGEGIHPIVITTRSGGTCTSNAKFHFRRADVVQRENETKNEANLVEPSMGMAEFRRVSMVVMATDENLNLNIGDGTEYYESDRDDKDHSSSDEDPRTKFEEVEQLKSQVENLERENKELRKYLDHLIVYLMEKYPDALESRRMYHF